MTSENKRPTIGIALDSGGAMGGAHIGVLEVLSQNDIPIDFIVGSSAGALVGALYATGSLDTFMNLVTDLSFTESLSYYVDPVFPKSGLLAGKRARKFINNLVSDTLIEDLETTYIAVATDLITGETVPITSGPLVDAVMASISMPGIFKPVVHMERLLTDGGVSDPLPLDVLNSCSPDITIACNLHSKLHDIVNSNEKKAIVRAQQKSSQHDEDIPSWMIDRMEKILGAQRIQDGLKSFKDVVRKINEGPAEIIREADLINAFTEQLNQSKDKISSLIEKSFLRKTKADTLNIFEIMLSASNIQQYQKNRLMLLHEQPDVLIEPDVTQVRSLEFTKVEGTIEEGRIKANEAVPLIKKVMKEKMEAW